MIDRVELYEVNDRKLWTMDYVDKKQIATHFMQELNVDYTKHEDKLVEDEIPEFILKMLKFIKKSLELSN